MKKQAPCLMAILATLLQGAAHAAETAYLRPGDVIVCVGDSITAAGVYDGFLQVMLDRLYPGAGIRIVNRGSGGKTAGAAALGARPDGSTGGERPGVCS